MKLFEKRLSVPVLGLICAPTTLLVYGFEENLNWLLLPPELVFIVSSGFDY